MQCKQVPTIGCTEKWDHTQKGRDFYTWMGLVIVGKGLWGIKKTWTPYPEIYEVGANEQPYLHREYRGSLVRPFLARGK